MTILWSVSALAASVCVFFFVRLGKKERDESNKIQEERRSKREEQLKHLRQYGVGIFIREKDGDTHRLNWDLLNALLKEGVPIVPLKDDDGWSLLSNNTESLKDNTFAVVGTAWKGPQKSVTMNCFDGVNVRTSDVWCTYQIFKKGQNDSAKLLDSGQKRWELCYGGPEGSSIVRDLVDGLLQAV